MLRNKHLQVKMVQDAEDTSSVEANKMGLLDLNILITDNLKNVVGGVVAIMVTRKVLNTACELVLIRAAK